MRRAIISPGRLLDLIEAAHTRERTRMAQVQRAEEHGLTSKILDN